MSLSGKIAIAGVYEHPTRFAPDKSEMADHGRVRPRRARADCGPLALGCGRALLPPGISMGHDGRGAAGRVPRTSSRDYLDGTNIGGSSFVSHVSHAAAAIHAGLCDVALILYGSTAASNAMAIGTGMGGGDARPGGVVRLALRHDDGRELRARRTAPHAPVRHEGRAAGRDRRRDAQARVAQSGREDAQADQRRRRDGEPRDLDAAPPARLLHHQRRRRRRGGDEPRARARPRGKPPVVLQGCGEAVCHQEIGSPDLLTIAAKQSGDAAFGMAGARATTTSISARSTTRSRSPCS